VVYFSSITYPGLVCCAALAGTQTQRIQLIIHNLQRNIELDVDIGETQVTFYATQAWQAASTSSIVFGIAGPKILGPLAVTKISSSMRTPLKLRQRCNSA
jgi:hypothetical protein